MLTNIISYFSNLNSAGQALFVIGVLLIITFIILLIVVLKPEKNKAKKIYGESAISDRENLFEEKMKDIDNISDEDINLDNDRTRNLKNIVDELRLVETKEEPSLMERIEAYEDEQEDTAIISVEELFKANKGLTYERKTIETTKVYSKPLINEKDFTDDDFIMEDVSHEFTQPLKVVEKKPKREVFSSVYTEQPKEEENNESFLNSLKEFRNNL